MGMDMESLFLTQNRKAFIKVVRWDFLAVPWLRLGTSSEGSEGSVSGWGTKILRAAWWLKKEFFFLDGSGMYVL